MHPAEAEQLVEQCPANKEVLYVIIGDTQTSTMQYLLVVNINKHSAFIEGFGEAGSTNQHVCIPAERQQSCTDTRW